ncbi:MAG: recombinase family protein [Candidatus Zixiibacteriota bacterium]
MIAYFIYARKSTESEDRQALSINAQISELESLAQKDNLKIAKIFTESKSARQSGRPVFNSMLKELRRNKASGILCWKLDRLTRNLLDGATISDLMENGFIAEIRTPLQTYRNNSVDRLMSGIDMLFARKYVDDLSENVIRGLNTKVAQGWRPNLAPMGYLNKCTEKGQAKIVIDPKRFKLIRKMWDLMLSGRYSVPEILDIANDQWGYKTRITKRTGGTPLSRTSLYRIFNDPFYYGKFYFGGELHRGKHRPMVTFEEFSQVQRILNSRCKTKPEKRTFAFSGLFRCGRCGAMITAEKKIQYRKSLRKKKEYIYYHCTYSKDPQCPRQSITEEDLIEQVCNHLESISIPKAYLNWIFKYYDSVMAKEQSKQDCEKKNIQEQLVIIDKKLKNLMNLKISPENENNQLLSDTEFLEQKRQLSREKDRLEESINAYSIDSDAMRKLFRETFELSVYAKKWFQKGDIKTKKTILTKIYSKRIIIDKKVVMSAKIPFEIISNLKFPPGAQNGMFEERNHSLTKGGNANLDSLNPDWRRGWDELEREIRSMSIDCS